MKADQNKRKKSALSSFSSPQIQGGVKPLWVVAVMRCAGYTLGYGLILFLALFMMAKSGWSSYVDGLKPFILVLPVYFFAVYRNAFFPPMLILLLGLVMDLFIGVPFGLSPLIALLFYYALSKRAAHLREYPPVLVTALSVVPITLAEILRWLGMSVLSYEFQPLYPALIAAIWSFVLYWPLSLVFHFTLRLVSAK